MTLSLDEMANLPPRTCPSSTDYARYRLQPASGAIATKNEKADTVELAGWLKPAINVYVLRKLSSTVLYEDGKAFNKMLAYVAMRLIATGAMPILHRDVAFAGPVGVLKVTGSQKKDLFASA
jgi:hypothetical protein